MTANVADFLVNRNETIIAAGTHATTTTGTGKNRQGRGAYIVFDITSPPGGGQSLTLKVEVRDHASGKWVTIFTDAAQTVIGTRTILVYPGVAAAASGVNGSVSYPLPFEWRATVTHSGANGADYSVGANYIK